MKKIILGVFALLFTTFVACKKDAFTDTQATEQFTSDLNDDSVIDDSDSYIDEKEDVTLDERGADAFAITAATVGAVADYGTCTAFKYKDYNAVAEGSNTFTLTGTFPATQGVCTVKAFVKPDSISTTITSWSATSITGTFTYPALVSPGIRKNGSVRFVVKAPLLHSVVSGKDTTVSKTKGYTAKTVGILNSEPYGSEKYELKAGRVAAGKTTTIPTTAAIDTSSAGVPNYVPELGDILENATGDKCVVVKIEDKTSYKKVYITKRKSCDPAKASGSWAFKKLFTPKTTATSAFPVGATWTKFAH